MELAGRKLDWPGLLREALEVSGALGRTYDRFHSYSFGNHILLWLQGVHEPVAGMKRWNEMNRRVKRTAGLKPS